MTPLRMGSRTCSGKLLDWKASFQEHILDPILNRVDTANQTRTSTNENNEGNRENRTLCVPYVRGLSEKIDNVCRSIKGVNMRTVFKPCRTIRQMLVRVKNGIHEDRRKGVIYEIPCKDCENTNRRSGSLI